MKIMLALKLLQRQRTSISKYYICAQYKISSSLRKINTSGSNWLSSKSEAAHKPNQLEKYLLVWMKKYPSVAEIPKTVSPTVMERVRNQARIKITIILMIVTAFVCVGMMYSGKQAAKKGDSVKKMNQTWHKEQNEKE